MTYDLTLIWALIIVVGVMMYVILDGFDLGIGIIFPFVRDPKDRDLMMNSVAPIWDGNETWLVLGGAALFGAFPLAYAVLLSSLYLPLIFMLVGLIFRGVAFEFRFKETGERRPFWGSAFAIGSMVATFFQGMALGAFVQGIPVLNRQYAGGPTDWLTPFTVFCGIGLMATFALLGCTWLIMKTPNPLQEQMRKLSYPLAIALLAAMGGVTVWMIMGHGAVAARWFSTPLLYWLLPVPVLVLLAFLWLVRSVKRGDHVTPFLMALALVFLGYLGLGISLWPYIIPPAVTIWDAASNSESQGFMLIGTLAILPVVLGYTAWSYYIFRGKVSHNDGYH